MRTIFNEKKNQSVARATFFLITLAIITGMVGCDGGGSQNLEIQDWYDLDAIRDNLGGHHTLMNDLDSTTAGYDELASPTANGGKGWQPIGTGDDEFTGSFDGQGYEIRDLFINRPDEWFVGLFGIVGEEGVIDNICVVNVTVIGEDRVGGLMGANAGSLGNSYSTGAVTGGSEVGGLVGGNAGTLSNSYSTGAVTGNELVGGLVGGNSGTLSNSYSTGTVTGGSEVGGLVGVNAGTLSNSYSTGTVTGGSEVGGLVGVNRFDGLTSNSFWDIETSGQATSDGGTGINTTEMQDFTTFTDTETEGLDEPWDIVAVAGPSIRNHSYIWNIVDDETYPFLSWQS